ncbi:Uma2 family endonuclease [Dyadobacter sp. BHUBP1]|uniref:Uma2 family endonuclease n=1 Tax=Dyadobacter sp. BHUBP1 TaxID=3424178 RepID=UPI003D32671C
MILPLNIPAHPYFTDDELVAFCVANPDLMVERDEHGQLHITMTPTFLLGSSNNSELIAEIAIWNRKKKGGKVIESNGGFFLQDRSMRVPDVAWIQIDRWNALTDDEKNSFPYMAPDFVIELKSKTDSLRYLERKMVKWIENGVRLAWLVCPKSQTTYVYEPGKPQLAVHFEETLSAGEVLVDFSTRLSDILEY